jgi:hypothetical protein
LTVLRGKEGTIEGCFLTDHEAFHAIDEGAALQFKGGDDAVVGQEQVVSIHVHQQQSFGLALHIRVLFSGQVRPLPAATVVVDKGSDVFIRLGLGGGAGWGLGYVETGWRQMGQLRCSRRELVRQEQQKVCPQEMVSGRRKTIMQIGQLSSSIYSSITKNI